MTVVCVCLAACLSACLSVCLFACVFQEVRRLQRAVEAAESSSTKLRLFIEKGMDERMGYCSVTPQPTPVFFLRCRP